MGYCVFRKPCNEILKNPVTLIQILAGKTIIKIDNADLMQSKLWIPEMINLENLHCIKNVLVDGFVVRKMSGLFDWLLQCTRVEMDAG